MIKVIVITKNKHRIVTRFGKKIKMAKRFRGMVKELHHPHIAKVILLDGQIHAPEKGLERIPGHMWCPYCGKQRIFKQNYRGDDYQWCEACGISDADFYVKTYNSTWSSRIPPDRFFVTTQADKAEKVEEGKEKRRQRKAAREAKAAAEAAGKKKKKRA